MTNSLEAITRQHAKAHFPEAFEEGSPWKVNKIYSREDAKVKRCVLKIVGPGVAYSFKHELSPSHRVRFAKTFERQQSAFQKFSLQAGKGIAEPVKADAKRQCAIFRFVEGQNLQDHLTFFCPTRDLQLEMVEKTGAWLDHFHRSGIEKDRTFFPNRVKHRYQDLRNDVEAGRLSVPETPLFTACIDALEQLAPSLRGQKTVFAVPHKDFHAANLIWDETTLSGIDVVGGGAIPVGRDINAFLIDFTRRFCSAEELVPGQLCPADVKEAFFKGYKLVSADDPTVQLFALAQLIDTWRELPADKLLRGQEEQDCLSQMRAIAKTVMTADEKTMPLRVLLSPSQLGTARQGAHGFLPILRKALRRRGFEASIREDSDGARKLAVRAGVHTLVQSNQPLGQKSLSFRNAYAEPFWQISRKGQPWRSAVARATFNACRSAEAEAYFDHWANKLHDVEGMAVQDEGFIYMPLQDKLLSHRGFQSMSPAEMIQTTLSRTNLPIIATLETDTQYSPAEIDFLKEVSALSSRFSVADVPMQDALRSCSYVVTQNSSAGFHAHFFRKPVVLFAKADFHHICINVLEKGAGAAFEKVTAHQPDVASYIHWFWGEHSINIEAANAGAQLAKRLKKLGY